MSKKADKIFAAIGGGENIVEMEPCATRVRITVRDPDKVDDAALKAAGAHGVVRKDKTVDVVVGMKADQLTEEIEALR